MRQRRFTEARKSSGFHLSIGDLMAAVLLIVLLLLITTVTRLTESNSRIQEIARSYQSTRDDLYKALEEEFREDLAEWQAAIDPDTLAIRFAQHGLFLENDATVLPAFQGVLDDFVPRYLEVLYREEFRNNVTEILVEGHTANPPGGNFSFIQSFVLANQRSGNVLTYFFRVFEASPMSAEGSKVDWLERRIGAVGFSHGRPYRDAENGIDWDRSRRVEFRVLTNADAQIRRILQEAR